jgi:hypothetical protein
MINVNSIKTTEEIESGIAGFIKRYPELLGGAVITKVDISGSQGKRRNAEIKSMVGETDVSKEASVGKADLQWIDQKALSFKSTVVTQLGNVYSRLCIRYSSMWILPTESMSLFLTEVEKIRQVFKSGVQDAIDNFDLYVQNEKKRSPKCAELIERTKLSKADFEKTFHFRIADFIPFSPYAIEGDDTETHYKDELLLDIAREAEDMYDASLSRTRINKTTLTRLSNLQDKILAFVFIDDRATRIADAIQVILHKLPTSSLTEERHISLLKNWLLLMSDTSKLERILSGDTKVEDWLDSIKAGFSDDNNSVDSGVFIPFMGRNTRTQTSTLSTQAPAAKEIEQKVDQSLTLKGW